MKKPTYFTTEQLANITEKLLKQGKPIWNVANHPLCPPDVKEKMLKLKALTNPKGKEQNNGR